MSGHERRIAEHAASHPAHAKAALTGPGGFGMVANARVHERYIVPVKSRRRCPCGCRERITHAGCCNGLAMTNGCEMWVRRWVREGRKPFGAAS